MVIDCTNTGEYTHFQVMLLGSSLQLPVFLCQNIHPSENDVTGLFLMIFKTL